MNAKQNTKDAKKTPNTPNKHQIRKKNTKYSKILQIFIYAVLSQKNLFQIHALFGVLFTGLKSMVVYQKGQI